jgi:hypothetical protein
MEPKASLLCSQEPATGLYPEQINPTQNSHSIYVR